MGTQQERRLSDVTEQRMLTLISEAETIRVIPLEDITLDDELQPRRALDDALWQEYMFLLGDGVKLPPVVVFSDGDKLWLADGYHRWHAHKALGTVATIEAEVRQGSYSAALRHSLSVNFSHGKRREKGDYLKAYGAALRHRLLEDPADADAVQALLNCSMNWAYSLTAGARADADAARDAQIAAGKEAGKTVRQIAKETGVPRSTVQDRVRKPQTAKTGQASPPQLAAAEAALPHVTNPAANRWWAALRALEAINDLAPVEMLMQEPCPGIEERFEMALRHTHAWTAAFLRARRHRAIKVT
jgi:ParB-like chromosome segregation protein Spo0J